MKLEEAIDWWIAEWEAADWSNIHSETLEALLRCADLEWQRKEMATFDQSPTTQTTETKVWKKEGP